MPNSNPCNADIFVLKLCFVILQPLRVVYILFASILCLIHGRMHNFEQVAKQCNNVNQAKILVKTSTLFTSWESSSISSSPYVSMQSVFTISRGGTSEKGNCWTGSKSYFLSLELLRILHWDIIKQAIWGKKRILEVKSKSTFTSAHRARIIYPRK